MGRFLPLKFHTLFAIIAFFILVFLQMDKFADDPGVGWHLKTGEYIWKNFQIPRYDPFLYSKVPRAWIADQWFSDLLLYGCFSIGSWPFTYAVFISVCLASYFIFLSGALRKATGLFVPSTLAVLTAFRVGNLHFIWRPVVFGIFLFAVIYGLVIKLYKDAEKGTISGKNFKILLFITPLIFCIWSNMHPSFVLGLFLFFVLPLALFIDSVLLKRHMHMRYSNYQNFVLLAFFAFVGTLINPWGFNLHKSILFLGESSFFMELHDEWKPIRIGTFEGDLLIFSLFLVLLSIWYRKQRKVGSLEVILIGSFLVGTLDAVRMFPYFGIVSSLSIAEGIRGFKESSIFNRYRSFGKILDSLTSLEISEKKGQGFSKFMVFILCLIIPFYASFTGRIPFYSGPYGPSYSYPFASIGALKKDLIEGESSRVISTPDWGGFITLTGYPKIRALIDDRNTLLGEDFYRNFLNHMQKGSDWHNYFLSIEATHALLPGWMPIVDELKKNHDLHLLHEDENSVLFRINK